MGGSLCDEMAQPSEPLWSSLKNHPFLQEIAQATLPINSFRFYLEQDIQYLTEFARCTALAIAKANDRHQIRAFVEHPRHLVEDELPKNEELLGRAIDLGAQDRGAVGRWPRPVWPIPHLRKQERFWTMAYGRETWSDYVLHDLHRPAPLHS